MSSLDENRGIVGYNSVTELDQSPTELLHVIIFQHAVLGYTSKATQNNLICGACRMDLRRASAEETGPTTEATQLSV